MGWSQGAFLAGNFALNNPQITDKVILVSMKEKYDQSGLDRIKGYLEKNKNVYLYKFYMECFSGEDKKHWLWFKENLLKDYIDNLGIEELAAGLDRISESEIKTQLLNNIKNLIIVHGQKDKIAPLEEIIYMKDKLPGAQFFHFKDAGHLPFLNEDLGNILHD